jgi:hypothetical protein
VSVISVVSVSNGLLQATGVLVQALEGVVSVAAIIDESLKVATAMSAAAVTEAGELIGIVNGIGLVTDSGTIKGSQSSDLDTAVIIAADEGGSTMAEVVEVGRGADDVAGVALTLLLAVARKNLIVVDELASTVVALDLVGRRDNDRVSSRGGHRGGASAVGHIGKDSIILREDDGRESLSGDL